jgi:hypothetical protein
MATTATKWCQGGNIFTCCPGPRTRIRVCTVCTRSVRGPVREATLRSGLCSRRSGVPRGTRSRSLRGDRALVTIPPRRGSFLGTHMICMTYRAGGSEILSHSKISGTETGASIRAVGGGERAVSWAYGPAERSSARRSQPVPPSTGRPWISRARVRGSDHVRARRSRSPSGARPTITIPGAQPRLVSSALHEHVDRDALEIGIQIVVAARGLPRIRRDRLTLARTPIELVTLVSPTWVPGFAIWLSIVLAHS